MDPLVKAIFLILALVPAGIAQTLWLSHPASRAFAIPIDGGHRLRGRRLLGDNKTLRGFMVVVPVAGLSFAVLGIVAARSQNLVDAGLWDLSGLQFAALGLLAGIGYMAGELPNSFAKRQLDIAPGGRAPTKGLSVVFHLADRLDSILGSLIAMSLIVNVPGLTWLCLLIFGGCINLGFSALLHISGVKPRLT